MGVRLNAAGHRALSLEVDVPGTAEQVWHAVATGAGIGCWFVPAEVEEWVGGTIRFRFGPEMDSTGIVTAWEPPFRFAYEEAEWMPGAPPLATELRVGARSGETCRLRLTHSLATDSTAWDDQFDSFERGWGTFFEVLKLYLGHFNEQPCLQFRHMLATPGSEAEVWGRLNSELGWTGAAAGRRLSLPVGAGPMLSGVVERVGSPRHDNEMILRLDAPAPGIAVFGAYDWGGHAHAFVNVVFYGESAPLQAAREEAAWRSWLEEKLPALGRNTAV